ncbi:hypothetical protein AAMO2058_000830100 [Amorphochlora amoebiformis]
MLAMLQLNLDLFVVRTLERPNKKEYKLERVQALKVVMRLLEISPMKIPRSLVQSMVLIMSKKDDDLRRVCLDRIRGLAFQNPGVVASTNGIHAMVEAILDPSCGDIAGQLTMTLLYLLDQESTRRYIRPSVHIQHILSVFTDTESPETQEKEARRVASAKALMIIMRSWTGIFILASDKVGLRSLVDILSLPASFRGSSWSKDAVFMLLLQILSVVKSEDLTTHKAKGIWKSMGPNLLHSYVVMVLLAFIQSGLVPILAEIGMEQGQEMSSVATNLLREILHLSADLLPSDPWGAQLNALPSVINCAASLDSKRVVSRVLARDMLQKMSTGQYDVDDKDPFQDDFQGPHESEVTPELSGYNTLVHGLDLEAIAMQSDSAPMARVQGRKQHHMPRIVTTSRSGQRGQLMAMHRRITTSSEEVVNRLMAESGVVGNRTREYATWDWDKCLYLLEGPLANPQYLQSVMRNTRFCKRLLSFIKPSKHAFSAMAWTLSNMRVVKVACQLFRVLCLSKETSESKIFSECVREILDELVIEATRSSNPSSGSTSRSPTASVSSATDLNANYGGTRARRLRPFSRESVRERLAREYFTLVGIVTSSRHGAELVRQCKKPGSFYSDLYNLYKDESKDYLARLILSCFSYGNHNKNQRTLLDIWVKQGSVNLRKFAVSHLRVLLRDKTQDVLSHFWQWGVRLLASQLGHSNEELGLAALSVLEEVCQDDKCLEFLIKFCKPRFANIGAAANNLQMKFLSKRSGVQYLQQIDWIEQQMQLWMAEGNQKYVEAVENALVGAFDTGMHIPKVQKDSTRDPALSAYLSTGAEVKARKPEYGYGFGGIHCSIRTEYDDYYFARLHRLPWKVSISLEYANRSQYFILSEAFVHTVPHIAQTVYRRRDSKRGSERESEPMMAETPSGLETYIAAIVIAPNGTPRPQKLVDGVTIRAQLSVGSLNPPAKQKSAFLRRFEQQVCSPNDRQRLVEISCGRCFLETKHARWNFLKNIPAKKSIRKQTAIRKTSAVKGHGGKRDDLYLESVWFKIPTPNSSNPVVCLAPHFFGELAKTAEGCEILGQSGHVLNFIHTVLAPLAGRVHSVDELDEKNDAKNGSEEKTFQSEAVTAIEQRTALWSIGQIGSSETGFRLLTKQKINVIKHISKMAMKCPTLSMRGTCFYIMGLLSRTPSARRMLYDLGWRFSPNAEVGIVIPKDTTSFLSVKACEYRGSWAKHRSNTFGLDFVPIKNAPLSQTTLKADYSNCAQVILGHLSNLCNSVTIKPSLNELRRLRKDPRARPFFLSADMMFQVFRMITSYDFQLDARRCVFDELFDHVSVSQHSLKVFDKDLHATNVKEEIQNLNKSLLAARMSAEEKDPDPLISAPSKEKKTRKAESKLHRPKFCVVGFNSNSSDGDGNRSQSMEK